MAHSLILGMTESGKTTLAKSLAARYQAREVKVIVLDPLNDPDWSADFQTTDPDEFLSVFWNSQRCAVFIDEAGQSVGRYNEVMQRTATRGRHWGHAVHFVTQRGVQLPVTVRDQCGHLFLFTTARKDAKVHADEWNCEALENANVVAQGNYFHVTRFGELQRGSLFGKPWENIDGTDTDTRNGDGRLRRKNAGPASKNEGADDNDDAASADNRPAATDAPDRHTEQHTGPDATDADAGPDAA